MTRIQARQTLRAAAMTLGAGMAVAALSPAALAGPWMPSPTIGPFPTMHIPDTPDVHPGKEYSHETDKNSTPAPDDSATILFDGAPPGGVSDGFDYDGADTFGEDFRQVDAMANVGDALFHAVRTNTTAMAVSFRDGAVLNATPAAAGPYAGVQGTGVDVAPGVPIYYETTGGLIAPWALVPEVDQHGVRNLDSLEIWGPEGRALADANRYSLFGDGVTGTAIYNHVPGGPDTTYLTQPFLAAALFASGLPEFTTLTPFQELLDIDALMVSDGGGMLDSFDDPADWIMFSLWGISRGGVPLPAPAPAGLIGDAIYVWNFGSPIMPLFHGGHLWSEGWTCDRASRECLQVDAMEALAVPAPASLGLLGIGLVGLGFMRRRRAC